MNRKEKDAVAETEYDPYADTYSRSPAENPECEGEDNAAARRPSNVPVFPNRPSFTGILDVLPDKSGLLRSLDRSLAPDKDDFYVAPAQISRFNLRSGDILVGNSSYITVDGALPPEKQKKRPRYLPFSFIETVNGVRSPDYRQPPHFDTLTTLFPNERFVLETTPTELSTRVVDLFAPLGKGQRGLIVAPPRTGKTVLLQKIANAIATNDPKTKVIILLIDERPEEVTDMRRNTSATVIASTFDHTPAEHIRISELVIEYAKRLVEQGNDVCILLDSITRLARAYNADSRGSGKILSGGMAAEALSKPKRFLGAARNIENGGSLTIIGTALIDTGSKMDEVIFEEYKGTGNMELWLDRELADRRIFPAINVEKSGTRKEELLLHPDELQRVWLLRRALTGVHSSEAMEMVLKKLRTTRTNAEFLMGIRE